MSFKLLSLSDNKIPGRISFSVDFLNVNRTRPRNFPTATVLRYCLQGIQFGFHSNSPTADAVCRQLSLSARNVGPSTLSLWQTLLSSEQSNPSSNVLPGLSQSQIERKGFARIFFHECGRRVGMVPVIVEGREEQSDGGEKNKNNQTNQNKQTTAHRPSLHHLVVFPLCW